MFRECTPAELNNFQYSSEIHLQNRARKVTKKQDTHPHTLRISVGDFALRIGLGGDSIKNTVQDKFRRNVGILYRDVNMPWDGSATVAVNMLESLERMGLSTILVSGKRADRSRVANYYGTNVQIHRNLIVPLWFTEMQLYVGLVLPIIAKAFCCLTVNPYTNDILPSVDVTYIHYPKPLIIREWELEKNPLWRCYYKIYHDLQRCIGSRHNERLVLANSHFTANAVKRQFGINPIVIYPPVDLKPLMKGSRVTKKNLVITISRFAPEKELLRIPYAARKIDAMFVVLGSLSNSKIYNEMLRLIEKHGLRHKVILVPNASLRTKRNLLQRAKVYFHTAPLEHFGISIVEGMASGCVAVVPNSGGPKEYVPQEWRYHDGEESVSMIKEALLKWSPSKSEEMRRMASRFGKEEFHAKFSSVLSPYIKERRLIN